MRRMFCFILAFSFLSACGGLHLDDDVVRRDDDREGDVELPEDLKEKRSFFDCDPEYSGPDNSIDVVTDMLGVSDYNPGRRMRECLKETLEKGYNRICNAREELERRREKARDEASRSRIESSIYKLDEIQYKFNQNLYEFAEDFDDQVVSMENDGRKKTKLGRFWSWLKKEETEGLRDILDIESYRECNLYSSDEN